MTIKSNFSFKPIPASKHIDLLKVQTKECKNVKHLLKLRNKETNLMTGSIVT
jgi:hypothetical protein